MHSFTRQSLSPPVPGSLCLHLLSIELTAFHVGAGDLNPGLYACGASAPKLLSYLPRHLASVLTRDSKGIKVETEDPVEAEAESRVLCLQVKE